MKIGVFTLTGPLAGKTIDLLDRYRFIDGKMRVQHTDALLMERILTIHYGAELTVEDSESTDTVESLQEGSLAVVSTKLGKTEGDKVTEQKLASDLSNADRVKSEGA